MKMESTRGRDLGDPTTMLGLASDEELVRVRAVAARYAPAEAGDLQSLIYLGQVEMGRNRGPTVSLSHAHSLLPRSPQNWPAHSCGYG